MAKTKSELGKLGWIASAKYREEKYKKIHEIYNKNPKNCEHCGKILDWDHRRNKNCNKSCGGNSRVKKSFRGRTERRIHNKCRNCKKTLNNYNKWCSKSCQIVGMFMNNRKTGNTIGKKLVRKYLLLTREHICSQCQLTTWRDVPIPLETHHKDGDHNNNEEENLELLCPNCHSLTDNYKSKNNGHGRDNRRIRGGNGTALAL